MYDNQSPPNKRQGPYTDPYGAVLQIFDKWFLDSLGEWTYYPFESTTTTEVMYDQPDSRKSINNRWVKSVAEYESFLLCETALPCTSKTKWEPAFRVSWTLTQEWPKMNRDYNVLKGLSITSFTDLPDHLSDAINNPMWLYGYGNPESGTNIGPPRTVVNPTK